MNRLRRYVRAFFILKNFPNNVIDLIERQHANLIDAEGQEQDNHHWLKDRKNRKFAIQNRTDFEMGLWDNQLERFYSGNGEEQSHSHELKFMSEREKEELLSSIHLPARRDA